MELDKQLSVEENIVILLKSENEKTLSMNKQM